MGLERCEYFRRAFPQKGTTRFEVQFCASPKGKGSDLGCGGYQEFCKTGEYLKESTKVVRPLKPLRGSL